ncbi:MAG: magnesium transporter [Candidatus Thorarchaeota archaeon]
MIPQPRQSNRLSEVSKAASSVMAQLARVSTVFRSIHRPGAFFRTFRQSAASLAFDLGGLVAGLLMVSFFSTIANVRWGLLIYPGILSARGVIGGIFSGRLSSGLHTGSISASMTENTREFGQLWRALIVLTLESSLILSSFALLVGVTILGLQIVDIVSILIVVTATMAVSLFLVAPITALVSFRSFKQGMDPDVIVYPIMSTVADITVTIVYVGMLSLFYSFSVGPLLTAGPALAVVFLALHFVRTGLNEPVFRETVVESFLTIVMVSMIVNVTGTVLQSVSDVIGKRPEIYIIYPALLDTMGDVGSIVGSTATTKIALGSLKPSPWSIRDHLRELFATMLAALLMCLVYSVIASFLQVLSLAGLLSLITVLLITALFASAAMGAISFTVAILTYRRGWDPDNFVIPIESSLADTVTSVFLLIALILLMY